MLRPRTRRRIRWWLVIYIVVAALLFGFPDRLILWPSRSAIPTPGATRRLIDAPTGKLEIWTMRTRAADAQGVKGYVLVFGGSGARAEDMLYFTLDQWQGEPVELWAVNFPGFGASTGRARLAWIGPAALVAFDDITIQAESLPVIVSGHSIGTTAALNVSRHRKLDGLVLHNPPPLRQLILGRYGWWNLWLFATPVALGVPGDLDSLANARSSRAPAVFILAGQDEVVLPRYALQVADAYAGPKTIVNLPNASHNDAITGAGSEQFAGDLHQLLETARARRAATQPTGQ